MKSVASICILAGMGSSIAAAQATAPCSLLTPAQVTAAVGATVSAGQPIATTGCSWSAPHIIATLSLSDASDWQKKKAPLAGVTRTSVAALGDDAFQTTVGSPGRESTTLTVKKGNTAYMIRVYGVALSEQVSMEKALAGAVLAKL
jgi:hypothetical protein